MFKKQLVKNIEDLDLKISKLSKELDAAKDDNEYEMLVEKIKDLTKLRCELSESKVKNSIKPILVSGAFSVASLVIVLKYEKAEIITSKAFSMIPSLLRGSK